MTRTMNTIPDEAVPLKAAKKSKSSNAKSILAAAATVSFIFGLLAATAVSVRRGSDPTGAPESSGPLLAQRQRKGLRNAE